LVELSELPVDTDFDRAIARRAALLAARYTDRYRRDQVSLSVGQDLLVEQRAGGISLRAGAQVQLQVPVWDIVSVRAEYGGTLDSTFNTLLVGGPHIALVGVASFPMKDTKSYLDLAIGPAFWIAEGLYWKQNLHLYGGLRTALGYDWRFSRRTGIRLEAGWSYWPGLQKDLPWLTQPLDVRAALTFWFGK
jgi:hypothetical protein